MLVGTGILFNMARQNAAYPGEWKWKGWLYLGPGLIVYLVFVFVPLIGTLLNSFFKWDGFSANREFILLENFKNLFNDSQFLTALRNNLIFVVFFCVLPIIIGLFLASLLGRTPLRGLTFYRTVLFLPQIISMVVIGVIWRWMFNPVFGPINLILKTIGLGAFTRTWLGDFTWALPSVGAVGTWVQFGFCMLLFLAGMQRIPDEYYEASSLDGASAFQQLLSITIPSLRPEIGVALITTIVAALRVFDLVFVTTRGGPGEATLVTGFLIYRTAFVQKNYGYASAIAIILTLVILTISLIIRRFQNQNEEASK